MNELNQKRNEIDRALKKAIESSSSSVKAAKLEAFNKICEELVKKSVSLKVTLVTKYMMENGHRMSKQSLYNKQEGDNPYRELFDLWSDYDILKRSASKPVVKTEQSSETFIDDDDLKLINDAALRYRISLMFGEIKGLKKQNDLMKQVRQMSVIQSVPEYLIESKEAGKILLNDYEIEVLREFTASNSNILFNEDGALIANLPIRKGQSLSSSGLKEALVKILSSYRVHI